MKVVHSNTLVTGAPATCRILWKYFKRIKFICKN